MFVRSKQRHYGYYSQLENIWNFTILQQHQAQTSNSQKKNSKERRQNFCNKLLKTCQFPSFRQ